MILWCVWRFKLCFSPSRCWLATVKRASHKLGSFYSLELVLQLAKRLCSLTSTQTFQNNLDRPGLISFAEFRTIRRYICKRKPVRISRTELRKGTFPWLSFGQSMGWKCRTRRLKMAASQNKATIKLDSRDHREKWTFHATFRGHNSPI